MGSFLLPCAATGVSLLARWCLIGATLRRQLWTPAGTLPHGRDALSARRMAVLWTFREPSLGCHVCRGFMRNALLDFTPIIPATACHQRNYVATYSRYIIGEILYGRPLQLTCNKIQQNDYSVAFGWLVAWKIKMLHVAIRARVAL
jgi:hypothetical protein